MNLSHVHTFLVVVETGNLNKAATKLNVTQSTVTARINALEDVIGQKLLRRIKSGAELTAAGSKFLRHAQIMVQVWKQARHDTSLPKGFDDVCNFGCVDSLWPSAGEWWVNSLRAACPTIALNVQCGNESENRLWLSNAIVDIAIAYEPPITSGFTIDPLFEDVFLEVSTVQRDLMRWDPMYVYVDHGEDFRRWHAGAFPVDETAIVTFTNSSHALNHILSWGGSAYLPARIVAQHIQDGRLFEVKDAPRFSRTCYLARNTGRTSKWPWWDTICNNAKSASYSADISQIRG
ncbi:LysR family transcriptional regulator [Mesorhizobium sp. KR2-14]|uniref:LysR family transcriptional regulator n=1 Tax=Mesorhizobium sp. KR2-14 TaxID=3156610 RepID=UPI0032B4ADDD